MAPGTLFVVATPIGNLEDITLRALRILRDVDLVAAEDTRRTGNLLRHYDIKTRLLSLHEHNERQRTPQILEHLRAGRSIALVSDAGTPGISDPGAELVRAVRDAGFPVTPIPGASAVAAAVSAAGLPADQFAFAGFPPVRSKDRAAWFQWVKSVKDAAIIAFESPHRLRKTLRDLDRDCGIRPIVAVRELTKVHEEWRLGTAAELLEHFSEPRGEFLLILFPQEKRPESRDSVPLDDTVRQLFGQITENATVTRREAVRQVAERLGLSSRQVYDAVERAKNSVV